MTDQSTPTNLLIKGRYRLQEVIGQGGMAIVWRGEDTLLGRSVAVKILRDQYARDPEFVERFRTEARSAASLNDPGVVSVYDVGEEDGRYFLVLELVVGRDLKQIIRDEAPLEPARAVQIAAGLAKAVGQAHAIGMVHRDIKPQNVLVTPDGRMKVADFGIARALSAAGMTAPGVVLGTVHYLAPEQAAGQPATLASDVYSLGVVLYEMLTGQVPFKADSGVGVAMKIVNEAPEPVDQVNPRVPAALAAIVNRSMAREPAARFPNATVMGEALEDYRRWSDQMTAAGLQVPVAAGAAIAAGTAGASGGAGVAGAGMGSSTAPPSGPPRTPPPANGSSKGPAAAASGPLLDRTGLLLGLVALAALTMLIPLWSTVAGRLGASGSTVLPGGGDGGQGSEVIVTTPTVPPAPTVAQAEVPDLAGREEADAVAALQAVGLSATTEYDPDATSGVPVGQVIRQVPPPGGMVPAGTVVKLVVSSEGMATVPQTSGDYQTVANAITLAGLVPRSPRYQWGGSPGEVLEIIPPPGSQIPYGAPVEIVVASGPRMAMGVDFEDNLFLDSVDLSRKLVVPGETLAFTPRWEAVGPIAGEYAARVVLRGADGVVISQDENAPLGADGRPTNQWAAGESLAGQPFELPVPPGTAPGTYALWLDVYRVGNPGELLPVRGAGMAEVQGNQVQISPIELAAANP
jgi:tRNA A-37 threonylcarbamoyl transferase component Bud32